MRSVFRAMRNGFVFPTVRGAIADANRCAGSDFRIVHFSVQADHLHLIVEASDRSALSSGMRGFAIRIARRFNRLIQRRGRMWADRWHGRALTSPRAVRNALVYVFGNFRKHLHGARASIDAYSSAPYFDGFRELHGRTPRELVNGQGMRGPSRISFELPRSLAPPESPAILAQTWLLRRGWRLHGLLSVWDGPSNA